MIIKKLFAVILFAAVFLFIAKSPALAVVKTSGDLRITADEPLFGASTVWYPGLEMTGWIKVENIGLNNHDVLMQATNTLQIGDIADQYQMRVVQDGTLLWGWDTMQHFWDLGEHGFGDVLHGQWKNYYLSVFLPSGVGNNYQGKSAGFDLKIGFKGTDDQVTVSTSSTNNGTGGTVEGASTTSDSFGSGSNPGVLGTQDNINSGAATASPEIVNVLGAQTSWWQRYWWILPLIIFGGLLLWWFLGKMRGNENH